MLLIIHNGQGRAGMRIFEPKTPGTPLFTPTPVCTYCVGEALSKKHCEMSTKIRKVHDEPWCFKASKTDECVVGTCMPRFRRPKL